MSEEEKKLRMPLTYQTERLKKGLVDIRMDLQIIIDKKLPHIRRIQKIIRDINELL